ALRMVDGHDPYGALPGLSLVFTYPPFAVLAFVPTLLLGLGVLRVVHLVLSLVALLVSVWCSLTMAGEERGPRLVALTLALSALLLPFTPVMNTLRLGQVDLILLAAVLVDLSGRTRRLPQGVLVGLAAGIKLLPGLFVVYYAVTGRTRAALVALATSVVTVLLGLAVAPRASYAYWTKLLYEQRRVGFADALLNQSLRSAAVRLHWSHLVYVAAVVAIAALGTLASARLDRRGERLLGVCVFATTGLLVAPISWIHHWVWAGPVAIALLILAWRGRRGRWRLPLAIAAVIWVAAFMTWPFRLQLALWLPAALRGWAGELYVVAGLTLVMIAGVVTMVQARRVTSWRSCERHLSSERAGALTRP
ncbi:MAG TPA: glycosyltransferase 87 family protein, partial [Thermoleophilia bacterium]|nr:glycosyltransferase 87 family protein [Thermoleophilia bacterium]